MSKCNKVKNPCKICLGTVTQKNGLQCEGICHTWVHYACLNYTPGRINDIKKGFIKVACPCPDCKTMQPKEYRRDEAFSCDNSQCPAHHPPKCENTACPMNKVIMPVHHTSCPISKCGAACKSHPQDTSPPANTVPSCVPTPDSNSDPCLEAPRCPAGCVNASEDTSGDVGCQAMDVVDQMCNTVGQLTNQINVLMCKMKTLVKDQCKANAECCEPKPKKTCPPPPKCPPPPCPPPPCPPPPCPKSFCPKPCFCPGNPVQKKC